MSNVRFRLCRQGSLPDLRHRRIASAELAYFELLLLDLLCQFDSANHDSRSSEAFQPQHRPKSLFDASVILLDSLIANDKSGFFRWSGLSV